MFEFLRTLIPGFSRKGPTPTGQAKTTKSDAAKPSGTERVKNPAAARSSFGQKPKAVIKPARATKKRTKR